jgi:hypothetical protein
MKNRLFGIFGKSALPTVLAGAVLAFGSPVAALAQGHAGGHASGRSFSGSARGFSGSGYSGGGRAVYGGRAYGGGYYRGGGYAGGLYLGFGSPYAYGLGYGYAPAPAPCGFYDQAGYWHAAPACYNGGPQPLY